MEPAEESLPIELDVRGVRALLESSEDVLLLDVREPVECQIACIENALAIPMGEIPSRVGELHGFRESQIVVHCHHGMRSLMVAEWLRGQGFAQVQNMTGGIDAWSSEIDRTVPRY
jgi:rhodanese-related sulfurtransferase